MTIPEKIKELGSELPPPPKPVGAYVAAVRTGNLVYTAGQLSGRDGKLIAVGKVPTDVPLDTAQAAARQAVLNALAAVRTVAPLESIRRVVRLNVFVNSATGFTDQAKVANGASELLVAIFGEAGKHARAAVATNGLPKGTTAEIQVVAELKA